MTDQERAQSVVNAATRFSLGCSNTTFGKASDCEECSADFLAVVSRVLAGDQFVPALSAEAARLLPGEA